jgi:hypothetical protein
MIFSYTDDNNGHIIPVGRTAGIDASYWSGTLYVLGYAKKKKAPFSAADPKNIRMESTIVIGAAALTECGCKPQPEELKLIITMSIMAADMVGILEKM